MGRPYFLKRFQEVFGPFTSRKLYEEAQSGGLRPTDLISRSKTGPWTEAIKVKGLDFSIKSDGQSTVTIVDTTAMQQTAKGKMEAEDERWIKHDRNPDATSTNIIIKDDKKNQLNDPKRSTSLNVLIVILMLGVPRLLVSMIGNLSLDSSYTNWIVGLQLLVLFLHCYVIWGISQLKKIAVILWYCALPVGGIIALLVERADVEFMNAFYERLDSSKLVHFSVGDVLGEVIIFQIVSALFFTAFIWPNRKLFW